MYWQCKVIISTTQTPLCTRIALRGRPAVRVVCTSVPVRSVPVPVVLVLFAYEFYELLSVYKSTLRIAINITVVLLACSYIVPVVLVGVVD